MELEYNWTKMDCTWTVDCGEVCFLWKVAGDDFDCELARYK